MRNPYKTRPDEIDECADLRRAMESLELDTDTPERTRQEAIDRFIEDAPKPCVYFMRTGDFVKIGVTTGMFARYQAIDAATPFMVDILATLPGDQKLERELHQRFAEHRHKYEWFRIEGALADYLKQFEEDDE